MAGPPDADHSASLPARLKNQKTSRARSAPPEGTRSDLKGPGGLNPSNPPEEPGGVNPRNPAGSPRRTPAPLNPGNQLEEPGRLNLEGTRPTQPEGTRSAHPEGPADPKGAHAGPETASGAPGRGAAAKATSNLATKRAPSPSVRSSDLV